MSVDVKTVSAILSGDRRALARLYRTMTPALRRYIRSKVSSHMDAEEILQDTLYAFLEGLRDFEGKASIKTYLFSICRNKVIDYYRRKKVKHVVFSRVPKLEFLVSPILGPEQELDSTLIREKIRAVLSGLIPQYREILLLKYLDGVSVEGIARRLSLTFKSTESKLFRARKAFVEAFLSV